MGFLDTVEQAKAFLARNGRVSLRALAREFALEDDALAELVEELVDVQQVAAREGKVLSWIGSASETAAAAASTNTALAASEPDAERRQLTVMFCDLVGSTDLSQRLDAEDLRSVVRSYQEAASRVIERYAGHVAQYLGDGLLVYFGHPQAHENDAERAVRAGLEILTALRTLNEALEPTHGIRLAARVGIHTGPVVIGEMGGGAKSETLALGDTTNIAARLEAVAAPDTVVVSGAAAARVGPVRPGGSRHPAAQGRRYACPCLRRAPAERCTQPPRRRGGTLDAFRRPRHRAGDARRSLGARGGRRGPERPDPRGGGGREVAPRLPAARASGGGAAHVARMRRHAVHGRHTVSPDHGARGAGSGVHR